MPILPSFNDLSVFYSDYVNSVAEVERLRLVLEERIERTLAARARLREGLDQLTARVSEHDEKLASEQHAVEALGVRAIRLRDDE